MRRKLAISTGILVVAGFAACVVMSRRGSITSAESAQRCEAFVGRHLGIGVIEKSDMVASGDPLLAMYLRALIKLAWPDGPTLKAPVEFCRATAKLHAVPGSEITVEGWLPNQWNGKLFATGGNGFNGGLTIAPFRMVRPLNQGYAAFATDGGHDDSDSAKFAYDSQEQLTDFAYRANHLVAGFAKQLVVAFYSTPAKRSYFLGCSNGGRNALTEAKRYPEDYDGIIAGAPAAGWSRMMTSFAWNAQAIANEPGAKNLGDKLHLIQDAVIKKCDALDGVQDGLLENPLMCPFDPGELQCKDEDTSTCLTAGEVTVLRKIYGGAQLRDGSQIYPGIAVGGEGLAENWEQWITPEKSTQGTFALETFRWMVYRDPDWKLSSFDIDRDSLKAKERMASVLDSDDPDLKTFVGRGGKLLLYHGWNDAGISPLATIEYYSALRNSLGDGAEQSARLFMVPGMMHCEGGVGPNSFDAVSAMDNWVEGGTPPTQMVATQFDPPLHLVTNPEAKVVRTRPLCPWPKVAKYSGSGSTDEAANFNCQ